MQLPGNTKHQRILQTIIDFYDSDQRILAVLLFGSLARGNWDAYSDLDLDIVMIDGVPIITTVELERLCNAIKERHDLDAMIIADLEEGDVVLSNLVEFSVRYHPLHDTKPAILDTMILLAGTLSLAQIHEAGEANRIENEPDLTMMVNQCIRYLLEIHNAIMRQRFWMALELLYRIRGLLMEMYAATHGGIRTLHFFEENASEYLVSRMKAIVPSPDLASVNAALIEAISLIERDLDAITASQYQLTNQQRLILQQMTKSS